MKRCRKIQKELDRYIDGELPTENRLSLENHLKVCAGCRSALEQKREERRQRISALIPKEVPLSTEEILAAIEERVQPIQSAEVITFPTPKKWWAKIKTLSIRPAPAIAFAICLIALGLSLFLPLGKRNPLKEQGIIIEQIESPNTVMIFQSERKDTTLIWIVPHSEDQEAT